MGLRKYYVSLLPSQGEGCGEKENLEKIVRDHLKKQRKAKGQNTGKTFLEYLELVQWIRTTKQTPEKVAGLVYDWVMNRFWKQLFLGIALGAIGTIIAVVVGKFLL